MEDTVPPLAGPLDFVAKCDDVERDIVLFEFLREADEHALHIRRGVIMSSSGEPTKRQSHAAGGSCSSRFERELHNRDCRPAAEGGSG